MVGAVDRASAEPGEVRRAFEPASGCVVHGGRTPVSTRPGLRAAVRRGHFDQSRRRAVAIPFRRRNDPARVARSILGVAARSPHHQRHRTGDNRRRASRRALNADAAVWYRCRGGPSVLLVVIAAAAIVAVGWIGYLVYIE